MKIEIECQCCHEKIKCDNHVSVSPCYGCGEWIIVPTGEKVVFGEIENTFRKIYFGEDK